MRIGVGVSYYGKIQSDHADAVERLKQKAGATLCVITGSPYPELARAELARQALMNKLDVLVIVDGDVVPDVDEALSMAENAHATKGVSLRSSGAQPPLKPGPYHHDNRPGLAFSAISCSVFDRLAEKDDRTYNNSSVLDTGFSKNSRPFFSPWRKNPGSVLVSELVPGMYLTPDDAFLTRVRRENITVTLTHDFKERSGAFLKIKPGNAEQRKKYDLPDYAVCIPVFGGWDTEQHVDVLTLNREAGLTVIELHNMPYLDTARGILVETANHLDSAGVFFIDHDIIFKPGDVAELIKTAEEKDAVVAGVYNMRKTAHALIGAIDVPVGEDVVFFEGGKLYPAFYTGMGFTAIPMSVFRALEPHFPLLMAAFLKTGPRQAFPFFSLDVNGNFYSGEDVSFCSRVHGLSVKHVKGEGSPNGDDWELKKISESLTDKRIFVDSRVRIFHKGSYCYAIEDHSINVPRYGTVVAKHVGTRQEMREFIRSADSLPAEARIRAQGLDEESNDPHGTLGRGNEVTT